MPNPIFRQAKAFSLLSVLLLFGCSGKQPPKTRPALPPINTLCVLPTLLSSMDPELSEADQAAIIARAQGQVFGALDAIRPSGLKLVKITPETGETECDAKLASNIVFLRLVKKENSTAAAAASVAGVALAAVVGIGFVTVPTAQMSMNLSLTESSSHRVLWSTTEQVTRQTYSFKDDYPTQALKMLEIVAGRIQKKFPIQKPRS